MKIFLPLFAAFALFMVNGVNSSASPSTCLEEYMPNPDDCSSYFRCVNDSPVQLPCPGGLHWNDEVKTCDWPANANCKKGPSKLSIKPRKPSKKPSKKPIKKPNKKPVRKPAKKPNKKPVKNLIKKPVEEPYVKPIQAGGKCGDNKKVVCYFTNWAWYRKGAGKYTPENIDPNLCTHIIYAFAVLDPTSLTIKTHDPWADIDNKFYEKVTAFRKKGIKVLIAIGGWGDSLAEKYSRLLNDASARQKFIQSVLEFIKKYNFDGLDLDLEYPACWQNNCEPQRSQDKQGFADLVKELSEAFKPSGLLLSAAVSASQKVIDAGYDVPQLSKYLDWISLMAYDYHGSFDGKTGHNAPFKGTPDNFNADFSVNYWMKKGAPSDKLVLGVPSYGQSFTLANPQNNGFNAASSGAGQTGPITGAPGTLSYYEICEKTKHDGWKVVRDPQNKIGPYAFKDNQWVSFDDVENIRTKGKYICEKNLGGGMIWALDFDDFTGSCGCGKYPILTALNQEVRGTGGQQVNNCT